MLVLVINSGSSSLKYQVRDVEAGSVLTEGLVEKIGMGAGGEGDGQIEGPRDHAEALEQVDAAIHAALGDRATGCRRPPRGARRGALRRAGAGQQRDHPGH